MKAVLLRSPEDLVVEEIPIPRPRDDEVLLKVEACGICGSVDGLEGEVLRAVVPVPRDRVVELARRDEVQRSIVVDIHRDDEVGAVGRAVVEVEPVEPLEAGVVVPVDVPESPPPAVLEADGEVEGVAVHCLPAQHWSRRGLRDENATLWASWAVTGPGRRFYFAGDTGYFDGFARIAAALGPFDLAAVPIGLEGTLILSFGVPIPNGPGLDLRVHANGASNAAIDENYGEQADLRRAELKDCWTCHK